MYRFGRRTIVTNKGSGSKEQGPVRWEAGPRSLGRVFVPSPRRQQGRHLLPPRALCEVLNQSLFDGQIRQVSIQG